METGYKAEETGRGRKDEAEEIRAKVHLESLRIVEEERRILAELATKEHSIMELEKLKSVQQENLAQLQLSIHAMYRGVQSEETHQAQFQELCQIYEEKNQLLLDSMIRISSTLKIALEEKNKLTEWLSSQEQEINQLKERMCEQELLNTKHIEQLHQQLKEEQALAAEEATALEDARKAKAMLEKRCDEESQQEAARLEVRSQVLLASSEQCSQLVLVHSKLARDLAVSNADIASLDKLKQQTEIQNTEQLASRAAEVGTWTTVLQGKNEELQVAQVEMDQLQQEEATALQHIQVMESEIQVSSSEFEQLRARDMELKVALEDEERAMCILKVSVMTENNALDQLMEGLDAEFEELHKKRDLLISQLQQERSSDTLDLESRSSQVEELKNEQQQKQQDLLTVQESLHVQEEECRMTEKKAEVNCQKISQLQTQVLCMKAERLAAQKVTADLSDNITTLNEKMVALEVNSSKARKDLMEEGGKLTTEMIQLDKERAQYAQLELWLSRIQRERDEANRCQARRREKDSEAHKARIERLTREYKDWEKFQVALEKQTLMNLELELQRKTKEDEELKAILLNRHEKTVLFHMEKENSEVKLLQRKKELENKIEKFMSTLPVSAASTPLKPLTSQGMPQTGLVPFYKDNLKPKGQALKMPTQHMYGPDVSSSPWKNIPRILSQKFLIEPSSRGLAVPKTHQAPTGLSTTPRPHSSIHQQVYPDSQSSPPASKPKGGSPRDPPRRNTVINPVWRM